jgi:hypothetical protein
MTRDHVITKEVQICTQKDSISMSCAVLIECQKKKHNWFKCTTKCQKYVAPIECLCSHFL